VRTLFRGKASRQGKKGSGKGVGGKESNSQWGASSNAAKRPLGRESQDRDLKNGRVPEKKHPSVPSYTPTPHEKQPKGKGS